MAYIMCGKDKFEIVESVPLGYQIWNIGANMVDGYLPLCRLRSIQPFDGACVIETETLKAVPCAGAQIILAAVYGSAKDLKSMEAYIRRYSKSKSAYVQTRVKRMRVALPYMRQIKWYT